MKTQEQEPEDIETPLIDLFMGLIFTLIGLFFAFLASDELCTGLASVKWPHVEGVVLKSFVEETHKFSHTSFRPVVFYKYYVTAEHENFRIRFGSDMSSVHKRNPQKIADRYQTQNPVKVYYNPADESRSVLEPGYKIPWWDWGYVLLHLSLGAMFLRRFYRCSQRLKHGHKNAETTTISQENLQ